MENIEPVTGNNAKGGEIVVNGFDYSKSIDALTDADRARYLKIAETISENDINSIQTYGSELSGVVQRNGDELLRITTSNSMNSVETNNIINNLIADIGGIDIDGCLEESRVKKFFRSLPVVRSFVKRYDITVAKYDNIANNVDKVSRKITATKVLALRDNTTLQVIFDNNLEYIRRMRELIIAATLRAEEINAEIERMKTDPDIEPYIIQDKIAFYETLQKRITDMKVSEYIMGQDLLQVRALQTNNTAIAQKSDNIVNTVIPIWKNQLSISIIMQNQKNNIEVQRMTADATNEILVKNAEMLKTNTINVAKANEESVVTVDTLKRTTQTLIDTMNEYKRIHEDGERKRTEINETLKELSEQLAREIEKNAEL
jgi:uncharacterized protein YaaN involved in tellurite resistance